ncbi:MAG: hypothetical protein Q8K67_10130 [Geothrix sp.]|nr:hypothetical protein [Geothrix sp.]
MKKMLISFALTAFAVTAFTQDKPQEAPAQKQSRDCPKGKQAECKGEKKCDKQAECKKADCPKAKRA